MYNRTEMMFYPIRRNDDGNEFISLAEYGFTTALAIAKADVSRQENPTWDDNNPVQRIARIILTMEEIEG